MRLELVEGAEVLVDGRAERAVGLVAAVGAQVLPEDRVQHVARDVEGERLLEPDDGAEVVLVAGGGQLLERLVGARHVGGVVLVVVQLHDLGRHVRLQRGVVVGQVGEAVLGHGGSPRSVVVGLLRAGPYPKGARIPTEDPTGRTTWARRLAGSAPATTRPRAGAGGTLAGVSTDPKDRWLDLGSFIREQRGSARLSLRRLSELAGISNPYLSQIERGLRRPSAEILQQIAKALRISAETLYVQAGILEPPTGRPT